MQLDGKTGLMLIIAAAILGLAFSGGCGRQPERKSGVVQPVEEHDGAKDKCCVVPSPEKPLSLKVIAQKDKQTLGFGAFTDKLLEFDVIVVGEQHDRELQHLVQRQIIKALYAQDERLGVGMEMFQRPFQKAIERYFEKTIDEDDFLEESEYKERWGYDWKLYRPIVEFCRLNQVPVAALNVPRELTKSISKVGFAGLTDAEKKDLGPVDFNVKAHRDHWYPQFSHGHGQNKPSAGQQERSYQVMTAWDDYMAQSATNFKKDRQLKRMVILAGSGHVEYGFGIPDRIAHYGGGRVVTVGIAEIKGPDDEKEAREMGYDYIICIQP